MNAAGSRVAHPSIVLRWHAGDPGRVVRQLQAVGMGELATIDAPPRAVFRWPGILVEVVGSADRRTTDRLELVQLDAGDPSDPRRRRAMTASVPVATREDAGVAGPLVAVGWATVDLARAERDFPGIAFLPSADDEALAAHTRSAHWLGIDLLLLEPATEGRVAAALARHGEGPVAIYVAAKTTTIAHELVPPAGSPLAGTVRLVRPARPWGPFLFVVERDQGAGYQRSR